MTAGFFCLTLVSPHLSAESIEQLSPAVEQGDLQALQKIDAYLQQHPDDYQALFMKARTLDKSGNSVAASGIYQKLIDKYPSQPEAYNNLAAIYSRQGKYKQAQELLEQAMRTHTSYQAVYENLSHIYVEMARSSYGKALQLDADQGTIALKELQTARVSDSAASFSVSEKPINKPVSVAKPVTTSAPDPVTDEIITTLQGWAAAWSEQATDLYLVFYADDFSPDGMSRRTWEQERRLRLTKPDWIRIGLSDFRVNKLSGQEARVELIQDYRASNYQDKTRKIMRMRQTPDGWRIVSEKSISRLD